MMTMARQSISWLRPYQDVPITQRRAMPNACCPCQEQILRVRWQQAPFYKAVSRLTVYFFLRVAVLATWDALVHFEGDCLPFVTQLFFLRWTQSAIVMHAINS